MPSLAAIKDGIGTGTGTGIGTGAPSYASLRPARPAVLARIVPPRVTST